MDLAAARRGSGVLAAPAAATTLRADPATSALRGAACGLAWLAGVAVQLHQPALWPAAWYAALAAAALVLGAWAALRLSSWSRGALLGVAAFALGLGVAGWHAGRLLAEALPAALEGVDVQLTGVVASLPQRGANGLRFRFAVEQATRQGRAVRVPRSIALGWYRGWNDESILGAPIDELRAGQRWRFTARLKRPHGTLNPHGFDVELLLFEQGVRASGYVRATDLDAAQRLDDDAGFAVERARERVRDAIDARIGDARAAGVLAALAVGDQGAIERSDWDLYRNAGIAHLMSISGLHVTMFAWLAGLALGAAWRRSPRLMLAVPAPLAARLGGLLAALGYALFSGFGVPAQRTVLMLAVASLLPAFGRRWPWPLMLLAAAVAVSTFDPWALLQPGFWLSFVAIGLLMACEPLPRASATAPDERAPWPRRWLGRGSHLAKDALRTQLIATLGLAPLTLVFFQQVSLVGLVANLLAIPVVTLLITPLALLGVFAAPLWSLGAQVVLGLNAALGWMTALPGAVWSAAAAPPWAQAAGLLGGALAVLPLPWRLRLLAIPLALPLVAPLVERPAEGSFDLVGVDVGQGTALLVRTREHLLVYDAGPQYSPESDAGQRVLLPLLRARGEQRIDRLMLSHRDSDHVGGAATLLRALPVGEVWSSLDAAHPLLAGAAKAVRCAAGQSWQWDGVRFSVLHPQAGDYASATKANALSCVLRVEGRTHSALLTGDIEHAQEAALVASDAHALRSELLVAPHHGSRTSSTQGFIDAVQPRIALFQAGYRNRFGHPAPDVLARYRERGIETRASAACGAFAWPAGDRDQGICQRDAARRYWHDAVAADRGAVDETGLR